MGLYDATDTTAIEQCSRCGKETDILYFIDTSTDRRRKKFEYQELCGECHVDIGKKVPQVRKKKS